MPRQFERLWWCVLAVLMTLTSAWGQSSPLHLYDNFDAAFLNPAKWSTNWQCGTAVLDCVRDIEDDALRLKVRGYGATNSSDGTQFGNSELFLTKTNATDIAAQVVVHRSYTDNCSTNNGVGHTQFLLWGAFFNGGGGTSNDDVQAFLQLDRGSDPTNTPPGQVLVGGFLEYQNQFFGDVGVEWVNVGEKFTIELVWDKPNHRFIIRSTRPSQGTVTESYMPYTVSDVTPAVGAFKGISARAFPANCLGTRTSATLDVAVTKVMTN
jgi:hypothetical protein